MTRAIFTSCTILALALMGIAVAPAGSPADPAATRDDAAACVAEPATAQHAVLARDAGTWDATVACFRAGPDTTPELFQGVETNTVMAGGLWVLSDFRGEFAGQPFQGRGQTGYDAKTGKYVGTWVDSMTSRLTLLEGTFDERAQVLSMLCDGVDPATGAAIKMKHVTAYKADGSRIHTMSILPEGADGPPIKVMEIAYTRRAK
jgi:Protein of unknown function (DUF1579)